MRTIIFTTLFLLCSMSSAAATNVAVIDMEKVIQSTSAGKNAKKVLESEFAKNKSSFDKRGKALEKESTEYAKKKSGYSKAVQMQKEEELSKKSYALEEEMQESQKKISETGERLTKPIVKRIKAAIDDLSKQQGISIVLEKKSNNVFWTSATADISDAVISKLK